jgi:hypothetical protein
MLYRYSIPCIDEGIDVTTHGYRDTPPTACPNNNTHRIDRKGIYVVSVYNSSEFRVSQSPVEDEEMATLHWEFPIPCVEDSGGMNDDLVYELSLPYTACIQGIKTTVARCNKGSGNGDPCDCKDEISMVLSPDRQVTRIRETMPIGMNSVVVDNTCYVHVGMRCRIDDMNGYASDMGEIVSVSNGSGTKITFEKGVSRSMPIGSCLFSEIPLVNSCRLRYDEPLSLLGGKVARVGLTTSPYQPLRIIYRRKCNLDYTKILHVTLEISR